MSLRMKCLLRLGLGRSVRFYSRKTEQLEFQVKKLHQPTGTFGGLTTVTDEDRYFQLSSGEDRGGGGEIPPLVIIFGWAGATHKNLSKYSEVYRRQGCDTLQYILPTRFIFRHTDQVHQAVEDVAKYLKKRGLTGRTAVHCLSDTGCMSLQGLNIASFSQGFPLTPQGLVWDSCPGPRPVVTIPKGLVLCAINWLSRMRDGMSFGSAVASSYDDFRVLAWQNYLRRLRGEECLISTMEDTWVGYWVRDLQCSVPEQFLYSKSDFYIPYKYLESEVIPQRKKKAASLSIKRWEKSPHVGHLRVHKAEYEKEIEKFLREIKFID